MSVNTISIIFVTFVVATVFAQPEPDDPRINRFVWQAFCTGNLPAEPSRQDYPVSITVYPDPTWNVFQPNQLVRVTLRSIEPLFTFTGFLIQAHLPSDPTTTVGRWESGAFGQPISCSDPEFVGHDAAAQSSIIERHTQELIWIVPETPGTYVFNMTTARETGVYWVDQLSYLLRVGN